MVNDALQFFFTFYVVLYCDKNERENFKELTKIEEINTKSALPISI